MQVRESIFRDVLRLFVWYPLRWVITIIPVKQGIALLSAFGDIHFSLSKVGKTLLLKNLALLQKDKPAGTGASMAASVREYFRNHYVDRLLIFVFPKFRVRDVEGLVEMDGLEHLDEALKHGKGVVLVHGHFGPVHLPLVVLARLGYRMKQIGRASCRERVCLLV